MGYVQSFGLTVDGSANVSLILDLYVLIRDLKLEEAAILSGNTELTDLSRFSEVKSRHIMVTNKSSVYF